MKPSRKEPRRIAKRRDRKGNLVWAKAAAQVLYRDKEVAASSPVHWRIAGQKSRWFTSLLPTHRALSWLGHLPKRPSPQPYSSTEHLRPFVLATLIVSDGIQACLGYEISGDTPIEVRINSKTPGMACAQEHRPES